MDVLIITLWLLGVVIAHLLLRRVVEIDNMNKKLMKERTIVVRDVPKTLIEKQQIREQTDEELQKELLEYVEAQDYALPKVDYDMSKQQGLTNIVMTKPPTEDIIGSNIVQQFQEERDINTGHFGNLQAFDGTGFAEL